MTKMDIFPVKVMEIFQNIPICECGNELKVVKILTTDQEISMYTICDNENCTLYQEDIGLKIGIHLSEYDLRENEI